MQNEKDNKNAKLASDFRYEKMSGGVKLQK
jgi:hypothetical protein